MDRIKVQIKNFKAIDHYDLWGNLRPSKYPNRFILDRKIINEKANVKRPHKLTLLLYYDQNTNTFSITFNGSIRKWYFGENSRSDLNKLQFIDCIKLLSAAIGIREKDLWNAKVTQLESGITLLLPSAFRYINDCHVKYRDFVRTEEDTTLYFNGKKNKNGKKSINYLLNDVTESITKKINNEENEGSIKYVIYDKYTEMNKNDKNFNNNLIKMNVHKKFIFFRFEIVVKRVSAVKFYRENANTLRKIKENWKKIHLELFERYKSITFVDLISKKKIIDPTTLNKRDLKKYEQLQAIIKNGFYEEFEKFNESNILSTNRSNKQKLFIKNYEMFLCKKIDYKEVIWVKFKKKLDRLV